MGWSCSSPSLRHSTWGAFWSSGPPPTSGLLRAPPFASIPLYIMSAWDNKRINCSEEKDTLQPHKISGPCGLAVQHVACRPRSKGSPSWTPPGRTAVSLEGTLNHFVLLRSYLACSCSLRREPLPRPPSLFPSLTLSVFPLPSQLPLFSSGNESALFIKTKYTVCGLSFPGKGIGF